MAMAMDILRSLIQAFINLVVFFINRTREAALTPDPLVVILLAVFLTVWLSSGCWAASIAEMRWHRPMPHFFLGLLCPIVYPLVTLFVLDVRGAKAREAQRQREAETHLTESSAGGPAAAETPGPATAAEAATIPDVEPPVIFDTAYFKKIMIDDSGNYTGPWLIKYGENATVARRIVDPLATTVVVEIEGAEGKLQKIRIPYDRIVSCGPM